MKTEIYNVEGIEIEVERTSKDDTEAERRCNGGEHLQMSSTTAMSS